MKKKLSEGLAVYYVENDADSIPQVKRGHVLERLKPFRAGRWFVELQMDINGHKGRSGMHEKDIFVAPAEANQVLIRICTDKIKRLADAIRQANG